MSYAKQTSADVIVIGGGWLGIMTHLAHLKAGRQSLLLEASEQLGGHGQAQFFSDVAFPRGFQFLPQHDAWLVVLGSLQQLLDQSIGITFQESQIRTYESGGFRPFLGFGDESVEAHHELATAFGPEEGVLSPSHEQLLQIAIGQIPESSRMLRSLVTRIDFAADKRGQVQGVLVNGTKQITTQKIDFCGNPKELTLLLGESKMPPKLRAKVARLQSFTAISVDLKSSAPITEQPGVFLLNGTTQDEIGPCIGRVWPGGTFSQWTSYLPDAECEDVEVIANALKKIKRQIKRAFPEAFATGFEERIWTFATCSLRGDLGLQPDFTVPGVQGLRVLYPEASGQLFRLGQYLTFQQSVLPRNTIDKTRTEESVVDL